MMADGAMSSSGIIPDADHARIFRDALGRFATGVTLVTIAGPDGPMGFTANSFASLSLSPPLVLWAPAKSSSRYPQYAGAEHFAIHILGKAQADWPQRFARGGAGFAGLNALTNDEAVPVLPGVLARFDCARHAAHDGGDHTIIVGRVLRFALEEGEPLVFAKGKFGGFAG
jgi:flavin reductase (DIM6/NTAB) family NADH-FMN oxidoreductase RutF